MKVTRRRSSTSSGGTPPDVVVDHAMRLMTDFDGGVGYLLKDRVLDRTYAGWPAATSSSTPSW